MVDKRLRQTGYVMDGDHYVQLRDGVRVGRIGPTVAVAYTINRSESGAPDFDSVVMHKHGAPEAVEQWAAKTREAHQALPHALSQALGGVEILQGPIPVTDLNRFIDNTGYLGVFLKRMSQAAEHVLRDTHVAQAEQDAGDEAAEQGERSRASGSMAFEITEDDVANVIASNQLAPDRLQSEPAELAALLHGDLDFGAIENAALMGDDMDEQTDMAYDEIAAQLRRMGVLLPAEACAEVAEASPAYAVRERAN